MHGLLISLQYEQLVHQEIVQILTWTSILLKEKPSKVRSESFAVAHTLCPFSAKYVPLNKKSE